MVVTAAVVAGIGTLMLYLAVISEQKAWLTRLVQSQTAMIEAVARFDAMYSQQDHPQGARGATMSQLAVAHETASRFSETGEFVIAVREGDMIVFPFKQHHGVIPDPIPFASGLARPAYHALMGHSGTSIELDYHGVLVLAAYAPAPTLDIGIVAKIDMTEVRAPFIKWGTLGGFGAILVIAGGGLLTRRVSTPLIKDLQSAVASLNDAQRLAGLGNWEWNVQTDVIRWSDETDQIFGLKPGEFGATYEAFINAVHPDDRAMVNKAVNRSLKERVGYSAEYRIIRPDAAVRAIYARGETVFNDDGKPERMIGTVLDITERKLAEEKIAAMLAEKEVLLQEIHHRVKNNLQVVSSMLSLQANAEKNSRVAEALRESERRVRVMARIHETLYGSYDMAHIGSGGYLCSIIMDMRESHIGASGNIVFREDVDDIVLDIDQAVPIGQIVSELISNALKHAFPDDRGGVIGVSMKLRDGGMIELAVADDGAGLPKDFDLSRCGTLGLQLVTALAGKLGGKVEVDRSNGTRFGIVFKGKQP
ncbi:MAG: hypothetical protein A3G18_06405 [Rhodospirillales bacterium RIFCSPLOWO2_12_FULL_58_28]|nr:MAG: hypothetical protein A3H92_03660 [Rhodospirillales bacterium RIFCSPLOWO2_02_FULL_58_16]OHC79547.1 MAG: hypothetical protein A3G18_06405 [Rhodospirillales bacterium RIFCSPLOWO2_12_FULL_58_28]